MKVALAAVFFLVDIMLHDNASKGRRPKPHRTIVRTQKITKNSANPLHRLSIAADLI